MLDSTSRFISRVISDIATHCKRRLKLGTIIIGSINKFEQISWRKINVNQRCVNLRYRKHAVQQLQTRLELPSNRERPTKIKIVPKIYTKHLPRPETPSLSSPPIGSLISYRNLDTVAPLSTD
jgi:hypothetical protein